MRVSAIVMARVLAFVESVDLNPRGQIFYPELVRAVVDRYGFQKYPKAADQFDEQKGVEFLDGKSGHIVIEKFTVFNSLLVLETRAGTNESKSILEEMLRWGREKVGLSYEPSMVKRFGYVSDLTFYSDAPLLMDTPLQRLAAKTSAEVSSIWGEPVVYEGMLVGIGHDPLSRRNPIAAFTIQRRAETPFSENKYFSEAPLPTDIHVAFLEQYEHDVIQSAHREVVF